MYVRIHVFNLPPSLHLPPFLPLPPHFPSTYLPPSLPSPPPSLPPSTQTPTQLSLSEGHVPALYTDKVDHSSPTKVLLSIHSLYPIPHTAFHISHTTYRISYMYVYIQSCI